MMPIFFWNGNGISKRSFHPSYSLQQTGSTGEDPLGLSALCGYSTRAISDDYAYHPLLIWAKKHRISLTDTFKDLFKLSKNYRTRDIDPIYVFLEISNRYK